MVKVFYFSEILHFAVEKERESIELYQRLNDKVDDPKVKDMFATLVKEEQQHEAFYSEMLENVKHEQTPQVHEDEEYDTYMQALIAERRKYSAVPSFATSSLTEILDYAIAREKDSVLFYAGLKNFVPEKMQTKVDDIICEETKHAVKLVNLKKRVSV